MLVSTVGTNTEQWYQSCGKMSMTEPLPVKIMRHVVF